MTLPAVKWMDFTLSNGLRLGGIFLLALVLNRVLRAVTKRLVLPAAPGDTSRGALARAGNVFPPI